MAIVFSESFDYYGGGTGTSVSGAVRTAFVTYAQQNGWANSAAFAAGIVNDVTRTGSGALIVDENSAPRCVLPAAYSETFSHVAFRVTALPSSGETITVFRAVDAGAATIFSLRLNPSGFLDLVTSAGTIVGTAPLQINANTWYSLQVRYKKGGGTDAIVSVRLNGESTSSLEITNGSFAQDMAGILFTIPVTQPQRLYIDDIQVNDTSGAVNNSWTGDVSIATLYPNADLSASGWSANTDFKFGTGVLRITDSTSGISAADSADFELGAADFTIEGWFKFNATPTGSNYYSLASKFRTSTNERSWQLLYGGAAFNNGKLAWRRSTDGASGTLTTIVEATFTPIVGKWYHIAVQRASGAVTLFVDGVRLNAPVTDGSTYHNNTSLCVLGAEQNGTTTVMNSFIGLIDEFRLTNGVGRYGSGFAVPSTAFPRDVGGDPSFNSVTWLSGFNSSIVDESSSPVTLTARGSSAAIYAPTDESPGDYKTIAEAAPNDSNWIEAPFTAATGQLVLTANAADTETVSLDGVTYTWEAVFTNTANKVLIGASADASINNLVAAINGGAGSGTVYGAGTTPSANTSAANIGNNVMKVTANAVGTSGNSIATAETMANAAWDNGATLTGGANIPGNSEFSLTRLPPQTTGVRGITIISRQAKTDAGPAQTQLSFVGPAGASVAGANRALGTSFTYYRDNVNTDPDTGGALTPASFVGAKLRINRTV